MIARLKPACIVIQNDPWNFRAYQQTIGETIPTIGIVAVDGKNCRGDELNGLKLAIFWTQFGEEQARLGGYTGPSAVIPLGVDLTIYKPYKREEVRAKLRGVKQIFEQHGMGLDAFVVGAVGRNQPRKRLDLTLDYFAEWVHGGHEVEGRSKDTVVHKDALLWLHVAPTGEQAYELDQLAHYYGITNQVLLGEVPVDGGLEESTLALVYNVFDIGFTTTQGEGFGLTTFEMMACGVPSIVPDWSALGELTDSACLQVECTTTAATTSGINCIGGVMDKRLAIDALEFLYSHPARREAFARRGVALVNDPRYRWENIGQAILHEVKTTLKELSEAVA
jgi:glycosyltransferase involved in cell wall biosynthesis